MKNPVSYSKLHITYYILQFTEDEMPSKLYDLLNFCYEDSMAEQFPNIEFQLFILSVKCLIPYENKIGCMIDLKRYEKEVEALKYYINGNDETLEHFIKSKNTSYIYDSLLEYKLLPIISSNTVYENMIEEIFNLTKFYSINIKTIIETIIISSCIFDYLSCDETVDMDLDLLNNNIKERLIGFSIKDFIENMNINDINIKNYIIDFEKERIKYLLKLSILTDELILKYKSLQYILNKKLAVREINNENSKTLNNFTEYLIKLRKGIVNPEKLKLNLDNISDLKEYLKSSQFIHPLLGKCIILKRSSAEIIIRNKLGLLKVKI